ncbi:claudin e [Lates japonicus]|uniref:Claudin n=1 Tax=Lates japonicus TaxID=270547 RepID=A0AAD3MF46_LATJO|nr:claudin e [Lates japonicus]
MVCERRQRVGFALAVIGFLGAITVCALPMWKFKVFFGKTVTEPLIWEGLWMYCVVKSTGEMQCKRYGFNYVLPPDLQVARALMVIAIIAAVVGIILGISAGKCTNFVKDPRAKVRVAIAAGIVFICAGILILITVSWSAYTISTGRNYLQTMNAATDLGIALLFGWGTTVLLILGGALLCSSCSSKGLSSSTKKE